MAKEKMITGLVDARLKKDFQRALARHPFVGSESNFVRLCAEALVHLSEEEAGRAVFPLRIMTVSQRDALVRAGVSID